MAVHSNATQGAGNTAAAKKTSPKQSPHKPPASWVTLATGQPLASAASSTASAPPAAQQKTTPKLPAAQQPSTPAEPLRAKVTHSDANSMAHPDLSAIATPVRALQCQKLCPSCGQYSAEYIVVRKAEGNRSEQIRCNECQSLRRRMEKITTAVPDWETYKDLTVEEKHSFMATAKNLFGQHLQKHMTEAIKVVRMKKLIATTTQEGTFEDMSVVEERYKNQPDVLECIRLNAAQLTDPVRGVHMVMIPKYSYKVERQITDSHQGSRNIQTESVIKKARKAIEPKKKKDPNNEPKACCFAPVKLSAAHKVRFERTMEKLYGKVVILGQRVEDADNDRIKPDPPSLVIEARSLHRDGIAICNRGNDILKNNEAPKGMAQDWLKESKHCLTAIADINDCLWMEC